MLHVVTQELYDRWKLGAVGFLSFEDRQAAGAQLFVPEFGLLVLKCPQPLCDVRLREHWPWHAVEETMQVLQRNPTCQRSADEHLALPIPFRPDRVALIYPPHNFLSQLCYRVRVADVTQRRALHV